MSLKIYSDITKEFYDNETDANEAEEKLLKAKNEKEACRREMFEKVEAARKNMNDIKTEYADMIDKAQKEYLTLLEEYNKKFGAYYYTISPNSVYEELLKLRDSFLATPW